MLLLLVIPVAFCVGVFILFLSTYLIQILYFDFLDHMHRYAPRTVASFVLLSSGTSAALLVVAIIIGAVLAAISPGVRRHTRTASAVLVGGFLVACLGIAMFVVARSRPNRKIATAKPVWIAKLDSIPSHSNTFAATRRMVFPDIEHLVIASASELRTLDTRSGEVIAERQVGREPYIFASSGGKVVLSAGGQLQLLSPQLTPLNISFPLTGGEANEVSPSGARIAWQRFSKDPPKTIFLDTESLKTAETFASCHVETMSDHLVAESVVLVNEGSQPAINVCEPGVAEHILYRGPNQPSYSFYLNNKAMLMIVGDHLKVIDSEGRLLGEDEWPGEEIGFAGVSRDGSRFAIATERWGFGDPAHINRESIVVYDASTFRALLEIPSEYAPYLQSLSAFTADGKAFAIGSGSDVRYFHIP